jgi:prevent-host-death family protein
MRTVSARQANHHFSKLLSRVERGEEILITKRRKPVALLSPYQPPGLTPERQAAINHAIEVMAQGLPWGAVVRAFCGAADQRYELAPLIRPPYHIGQTLSCASQQI